MLGGGKKHKRTSEYFLLVCSLSGAQTGETRMQTQQHVARLRTGSVGLKLVTGGQNLSNCDHTRQTLTEEYRIPETKGGRESESSDTCAVHTVHCAGETRRHR